MMLRETHNAPCGALWLRLTDKPPSVSLLRGRKSSLWDAHYWTPRAVYPALSMGRAAPVRLLDLAPSGVCPAAPDANRAGGLLHHRFTLAACAAICFSVALCRRVAPPGISP